MGRGSGRVAKKSYNSKAYGGDYSLRSTRILNKIKFYGLKCVRLWSNISPRHTEACRQLGILPEDLEPKSEEYFRDIPSVKLRMIKMEKYEEKRRYLQQMVDERSNKIQEEDKPDQSDAELCGLIAMEKRKVQEHQKRMQIELEQTLAYEMRMAMLRSDREARAAFSKKRMEEEIERKREAARRRERERKADTDRK